MVTSKKSKSSKKTKSKKAIDRPFDKAILAQATKLANQYQVIIERDQDDPGCWMGRGLELPMTMGDGSTPQACIKNTIEALVATVAYMIEEGQIPPVPANAEKRTFRASVRLNAHEKFTIESDARRKGFASVSDYLRRLGIEAAAG